MKRILLITLICLSCTFALGALAAVPGTSGNGLVINCGNGGECGWTDLIAQVNQIITFLLYFATLLATISFIYAGFLLITSGGNTGKVEQAKEIFWNVVVGLVLAYLAWLIVHLLLATFGVSSSWSLL